MREEAERRGGTVVHLFNVAETASRREERKAFGEFLRYCRSNAKKLDGVLFLKVDRGARNMRDFIDLKALEEDFGLRLIFVSQHFTDDPSGRVAHHMMAAMAAHATAQQARDIRDGHRRRVVEHGCSLVPPPMVTNTYGERGGVSSKSIPSRPNGLPSSKLRV